MLDKPRTITVGGARARGLYIKAIHESTPQFSNDPTNTAWVHSEPDSPAVHYAPIRSWSGKLNCVHHLVMGATSKLHSRFCMNAGTSNSFLFDQQIPRTTIIAHSTCLWARIHRPGCSVNNPGNSNETPLTRSLFSSFVFSVGHSSHPNLSPQLLTNWVLVVEVERVEVDRIVVKGYMVS